MNETLRRDADAIIGASLSAVLPDEAVRRALKAFQPKGGKVMLVAAGKAGWQMPVPPWKHWAGWTAVWS